MTASFTRDPARPMEPLMTVREVAAFLRKSSSWVYHQAAADRIPGAVRIGGSLRFNPEVIQRFGAGETTYVLPWRSTTE